MPVKKRRGSAGRSAKPPPDEVPEEEQWRLFSESGILDQVQKIPRPDDSSIAEVQMPLFDAFLLFVPFTFLYLTMDMLIHQQYGQPLSLIGILSSLGNSAPMLALYIYFTNGRKDQTWLQAFLFAIGVTSGSRLIFLLNKSPWKIVIRQAPPLATLWVYSILQLRLSYAVISLVTVYIWLWWKGLTLRL